MRLSRTTWILAIVAALLALFLVLPARRGASGDALPELPAVDRDTVTRVTFETAGQRTVIERQDDVWRLLQPLQAEADATALKTLLMAFRKPVPMDARVDEGNLETYELDDNKGVRFEVFAGGAEPLLAMVVGKDVEGGSTLIRLAGSDDVYRARVGGGYRFRREASAWRNRSVLSLDPDRIAGLTVEGAAGALTFLREPVGAASEEAPPTWSPWRMRDDPLFPVDQKAMDAMVRTLAALRASEVHAQDHGTGWDRPAGAFELALSDGATHRIVVVPADDGASALARVDGRPDVFRIAATHLKRLESGRSTYRDRTLYDFSKEQVDSLILVEGTTRVRVQQDLGTRMWRVVEPVSMEADLRAALTAVHAFGTLRATRVAEDVDTLQAGLDTPRARYEARLLDGRAHVLEVGASFRDGAQEYVWARRAGDPTVWVLPAETLARMRAAFLKG